MTPKRKLHWPLASSGPHVLVDAGSTLTLRPDITERN